MKLFGRTSGYYLFWTGFVYFWVGMLLALTHSGLTQYATLGFILTLSVPLCCPPVARHFNMEPVMFDFFKSREDRLKDYSNVVKFPEPVAAPSVSIPVSKSPEALYTVGVNDEGSTQIRIKLENGSATMTMTPQGVLDLIEDLAHSIRKTHVVEIFDKEDTE